MESSAPTTSVARQRRVHVVDPGHQATVDIPRVLEPGGAKFRHRLRAAVPGAAVDDHVARRVELTEPVVELAEWDERPADVHRRVFGFLAYVEQREVGAGLAQPPQLPHGDVPRALHGRL